MILGVSVRGMSLKSLRRSSQVSTRISAFVRAWKVTTAEVSGLIKEFSLSEFVVVWIYSFRVCFLMSKS